MGPFELTHQAVFFVCESHQKMFDPNLSAAIGTCDPRGAIKDSNGRFGIGDLRSFRFGRGPEPVYAEGFEVERPGANFRNAKARQSHQATKKDLVRPDFAQAAESGNLNGV